MFKCILDSSQRCCARSLWLVLFQLHGSIWCNVLPYCLLNCGLMVFVEMLGKWDIKIAFSPSGHALMTLLISYLVVAKINLSYERYMKARFAIGHALSGLRELNQLALVYSTKQDAAWRKTITEKIIDLMDCTIRVVQNEKKAIYLARHDSEAVGVVSKDFSYSSDFFEDPLLHVEALRMDLYWPTKEMGFELLERMKLGDMLNDFAMSYRTLLALASTPMPFPLVQMARTFLFLWVFSLPFALRGVVDESYVAMIFVFFLTYGFIGLELVGMKLMFPFGDSPNDLHVTGMREATMRGIERDLRLMGEDSASAVGDRRLEFKRQKAREPSMDDIHPVHGGHDNAMSGEPHSDSNYMAMHAC